jgi:hypothetical protein
MMTMTQHLFLIPIFSLEALDQYSINIISEAYSVVTGIFSRRFCGLHCVGTFPYTKTVEIRNLSVLSFIFYTRGKHRNLGGI